MDTWKEVLDSEYNFISNRMEFMKRDDRLHFIRKALSIPSETGTALRICFYLSNSELTSLYEELLDLSLVAHSDITLVRDVIYYNQCVINV